MAELVSSVEGRDSRRRRGKENELTIASRSWAMALRYSRSKRNMLQGKEIEYERSAKVKGKEKREGERERGSKNSLRLLILPPPMLRDELQPSLADLLPKIMIRLRDSWGTEEERRGV